MAATIPAFGVGLAPRVGRDPGVGQDHEETFVSEWTSERRELWEVIGEMLAHGLVVGSSGNASLRLHDSEGRGLVLITPGRRPYRHMTSEDLVVVDLQGDPVGPEALPSTETALHIALYKARPDVGAVVHTHSPFASVAAMAGLEIPPIIDEVVMAVGGSVAVAEYGFPSSEELAQRACEALEDKAAVLLRNHGLVAVGGTASEALEVALLVEHAARTFIYHSMLDVGNRFIPTTAKIAEDLYRMRKTAQRRESPRV